MISVERADLSKERDAKLLVVLLDTYARDPMGGGESLSEYCQQNLASELAKRPFAHVFFASVDGTPAGLAVCFEGFSTFCCAPLLNFHDICVLPQFRRQGVASSLIFFIEQFAKNMGCCKLTLEVLEGNHAAKQTYQQAGFRAYELDPQVGAAQFWQKIIE